MSSASALESFKICSNTFTPISEGSGAFEFDIVDVPCSIHAQLEHIIEQRDEANTGGPSKRMNIFEICPNTANSNKTNKLFDAPPVRSNVHLTTSPKHTDITPWTFEQLESRIKGWVGEWDDSKSKQAITELFATHRNSIRANKPINKVIGIGLSKPGTRSLEPIPPGAVEPSEAFETHWKPIEIVEDPQAFTKIDNHAFVFHCHMAFDVGEIALLAAGAKGLAVMMSGGTVKVDPGNESFDFALFKAPLFTVAQLQGLQKQSDDARNGLITRYTAIDSEGVTRDLKIPSLEGWDDHTFVYGIGYRNIFKMCTKTQDD
ncbi:hypothetical protein CC86DRAFT_382781 [Ophiobolus disseminans]|uniref:Uncharacterized protein n=1 Tax=Ophiobolus disseminans TaxID=1469910 RepID=A0A6A6ZZN0_9PLEO|nr:hypothetical protein CC86DRAFT_382781 [Ophiobolus disseminans]